MRLAGALIAEPNRKHLRAHICIQYQWVLPQEISRASVICHCGANPSSGTPFEYRHEKMPVGMTTGEPRPPRAREIAKQIHMAMSPRPGAVNVGNLEPYLMAPIRAVGLELREDQFVSERGARNVAGGLEVFPGAAADNYRRPSVRGLPASLRTTLSEDRHGGTATHGGMVKVRQPRRRRRRPAFSHARFTAMVTAMARLTMRHSTAKPSIQLSMTDSEKRRLEKRGVCV